MPLSHSKQKTVFYLILKEDYNLPCDPFKLETVDQEAIFF